MPSFFALTSDGAIYAPISGRNPGQASLLEFAPRNIEATNAITGDFLEPVGAALQAEAF